MRRRDVLKGGALLLAFSLAPQVGAKAQGDPGGEGEAAGGARPGSLSQTPRLDSWIRVEADGRITVFTGKAELGQGIRTALWQVAVEELHADPALVTLQTADTSLTPDEGYTAGSQSMAESGTAIRHAGAQVRELLVAAASRRLGLDAGLLRAEYGRILAPDGRSLGFGDVAGDANTAQPAAPRSRLTDPAAFRIIGQSVPRRDLPAKLAGAPAYVQDLRLPGMLHARLVRPPQPRCRLLGVDVAATERMPGIEAVVREGSFLAVVARSEYEAIRGREQLAHDARWSDAPLLPDPGRIHDWLRQTDADVSVIHDETGLEAPAGEWIAATFRRPYQMHGSIGPSCAVAHLENGSLTVWSHTQGVSPDRAAIAELVGLDPSQVRVIHQDGSGCYGHNGADDAAGDAALIASRLSGRPVRVQWMREDEHVFEPYGSAMVGQVGARLSSDGRITQWRYDVWSTPHSTRPGTAGNLLAGRLLDPPRAPEPPADIPQPTGGGDRNAIPGYALPNLRVVKHFVPQMPLRVSAMRGLGAFHNVFSIESFMDELALRAEADPVAFRLAHLQDPRARAVVERAAGEFGWTAWRADAPMRGRGFAYARYKLLEAYCAVALEVEVERDTGEIRIGRVVAAVDAGEPVNPDGIRNQIEGGIVQSASWTLLESVRFSADGLASRDWATYPILRFGQAPASIAVHVVDRPGDPFLGTGEAAQGPAAAAIANAVADASGARIRDLPLRADRITAALAG
ncbi:xanthine dehydrogenase family protein molybdopterin-binding subunit [Aureimonas jatrophae]|uniref:CO or xanthine dehydrogenase, Mo-binding subunit n=1 Tax=Aureimonas jatrophae TaxID=1166073 RepID=A0A1H0BUL8_9HYPH|nr:molybdopterin cofactor-binding domain-containing protein [Aureimonas jatrophae]MBB3948936.1 CO/xanthine dehydrogenase Mo-binding subunit [Aureimonas jatrophae]SDN49293.1 CO or xanthine dehydrogenase, Mo-binding subunit [Aureimonas jatrophae]